MVGPYQKKQCWEQADGQQRLPIRGHEVFSRQIVWAYERRQLSYLRMLFNSVNATISIGQSYAPCNSISIIIIVIITSRFCYFFFRNCSQHIMSTVTDFNEAEGDIATPDCENIQSLTESFLLFFFLLFHFYRYSATHFSIRSVQ